MVAIRKFGTVMCGAALIQLLAGCGSTSSGAARVEPVTVATVLHSAYAAQQNGGKGAQKLCANEETRLPLRAGGWKKRLKADYRPGSIDLNCYHFIDQPDHLAYDLAAVNRDYRNRLAAILMKQADDVCTSEKALLVKHQAEMNSATSILTSVFAGASTVVSGELAQKILSASAGLSNSTRDHLNTHIYRNQIIQTITRAIDSERRTIADQIGVHDAQDNKDYSADAMIRDVNHYHQVCSIAHGLQVVMEAVEKREDYIKEQKAEAILQQVRNLQYDPGLKSAGMQPADVKKLMAEAIKLRTGVDLDAVPSVQPVAPNPPPNPAPNPVADDADDASGDGGSDSIADSLPAP